MTPLPTTLTVEALKEIRDWLDGYMLKEVVNPMIANLDSWIAELSPMEEPPPQSGVRFFYFGSDVFAVRENLFWFITGYTQAYTWQDILKICSHPQIIYTPEGSE